MVFQFKWSVFAYPDNRWKNTIEKKSRAVRFPYVIKWYTNTLYLKQRKPKLNEVEGRHTQ